MSDLQKKIQSLLDDSVAQGNERGIQVAIYRHGQLIVDAWSGIADSRTGAVVDGDTLFPVFSTTKGIMATAIHLLAERGQLDYDTPIAAYWPEFAAQGKQAITVRHALAHTAGLPYLPDGLGPEQICDWDYMCQVMAETKPASPPGERQFYHAITYGWILGELARRVSGRPLQEFFKTELCAPLGIETMFCGVPAGSENRIAHLEGSSELPAELPRDAARCMLPLHDWMNRPEVQRLCQPGYSGIMSARAVARHYAALLPGGVEGVELLPPHRIRLAVEEQVPLDRYASGGVPRGLGYHLAGNMAEMMKSPTAFGHPGYGGANGFADTSLSLSVGFTRNRFLRDSPLVRILEEILQAA